MADVNVSVFSTKPKLEIGGEQHTIQVLSLGCCSYTQTCDHLYVLDLNYTRELNWDTGSFKTAANFQAAITFKMLDQRKAEGDQEKI